jgi:hypothetical protein
MPVQRLSSESQCSTDSFLSYGNVASCLPISIHYFDRQLTKETEVTVEKTMLKLEADSVLFLNSTDGNGESLRMAAKRFPIRY